MVSGYIAPRAAKVTVVSAMEEFGRSAFMVKIVA